MPIIIYVAPPLNSTKLTVCIGLDPFLRAGARQLLAQAVEAEVDTFLATVKDLKLADGRARVVRHGYAPARMIATGIGPVEVARAKIRDRGTVGDGERIRFSSAILALWARRTRSLDALLPARTSYIRVVLSYHVFGS
jgi:hypothetical protein